MDYILFAIALLLLLSAGAGISELLVKQDYSPATAERFSLSFLFGSAFVSLAQFALGLVVKAVVLKSAVSVFCLLLGLFAAVRAHRRVSQRVESMKSSDWLWISVLILQSLIVFWVSLRLSFAYDGIFLWEAKARLIFQSGGTMPINYFRADPAVIPFPSYPLLLPFTENWFYVFLGRPHQGWLKLVLPLFYVSAIGLLIRRGYLPAVLMFFVPVMMIRSTSNEADFPLAVFYLGCGGYLLDYLVTRNSAHLRLAAAFGAILPWVKAEGAILFMVVVAVGVTSLIRERKWKAILLLSAPGAVLLLAWRSFLTLVGATAPPVFFPVSLATITANIHRVPVLALETWKELSNWQKWSLLWLLPFTALVSLKTHWAWLAMIAAPIFLYASIYIFSAWNPFTLHIEASYSRILTHLALLTLAGAGIFHPASRFAKK